MPTKKNTFQPRLGFIGIGRMGEPMVQRLLASGVSVQVWNRSTSKLHAVIKKGAIPVGHAASVIKNADIILLCLADSSIVEKIVTEALLPNGLHKKLIIDLSSTHPEITRKLAIEVKINCDIDWVDAPVSGGVMAATAGTLSIMAGGTEHNVQRAKEILAPLYAHFTHMGEVGSGQVTKLCHQMLVGCHALVIAEMMALAEKSGVDSIKIADALKDSVADSKALQLLAPDMAGTDFSAPKWPIKTLLKEITMATDLAQHQATPTPMSALAAQLMQLHAHRGDSEQDLATLIKLYDNHQ